MKRIVTIGGGTGRFTLLLGLKKHPVDISAIVAMSDNGGSTGRLRDELGVLPPGDIRQCLIALSGSAVTMRKLMSYRFEKGGLAGHNFGNILISTLEKITGSLEESLRIVGAILNIKGRVIPVTTDNVELVATLQNGKTIRGEDALDHYKLLSRVGVKDMYLKPHARANARALKAIREADLLVVGPGDIYTSLIPNFLVDGIAEAFVKSKAKKVYVANLMNLKGHTDNFSVADYVDVLEEVIGKRGVFDAVVCNTRKPSPALLKKYKKEGTPVVCDRERLEGRTVTHADVLASGVAQIAKGDKLRRVLIRHDSEKLAHVLIGLLSSKK
jgi:uncharacterized cofD-like protein